MSPFVKLTKGDRVDDGILPAPLAPACAGYPQGGVPVARGLVARFLAPSPLQPPVVVDSNPATLMHKKSPAPL